MVRPRKVLITGAQGNIGRAACAALRAAGHWVRGFDLLPSTLADESVVGSITDAAALAPAASGMEMAIHLAATIDDADFMTKLLPNNIVGLYQVLEAARVAGVKRICLASSIQADDRGGRGEKIQGRMEEGRWPRNHYAATKLFAEDMGLLYANRFGMEVACPRVGWVPRNMQVLRRMVERGAQDHFLSHDDAGRFFVRFVECEKIQGVREGYAVMYLVSRRRAAEGFDFEGARVAVGYEPRDIFPEGLGFAVENV